jgi:Lrp/AsnC family transcriptional regulator, regulator for asnA, asnC and gidA
LKAYTNTCFISINWLKILELSGSNGYLNLNGNKISNKYSKPRSLDPIDLRIISTLYKDSNTPFVEIARNIGISDATVHMRVKRLMTEGIIRKFTIVLNYDVIGYDHLAFLGINTKPGFADIVTSKLSLLDPVLEIHEMHGRFDLMLKIRAKNLEEMRDIIENRIKKLPHIVKAELLTVLKSVKEEQIIPLDAEIDVLQKDIV